MIELKDMSIAQLEHLRLQTEEMLRQRKKERHIQLAGNVVDAIQALVKEFRTTSIDTEIECPDCECTVTIDLIDLMKNLKVSDFTY